MRLCARDQAHLHPPRTGNRAKMGDMVLVTSPRVLVMATASSLEPR